MRSSRTPATDLGGSFLDQNFDDVRHVIDANVTGTLLLIQKVGLDMRARRRGRILIVGLIAGFIPGTYTAVYNGTKAFIDSFSFALRAELEDSGDDDADARRDRYGKFDRAGMMDTKVGQQKKDDPADKWPASASMP